MSKLENSKTGSTTKNVNLDPQAILYIGESQLKGFMDFIRTQGVVGLAVGLVLGGAVSILVKSLVDNIVMPPLGFVLGSAQGLKGLSWTMGITSAGAPAVLNYGMFLNDLINFIVIAVVVYFVVKLLRFDRIDIKK
jgi:large conductance mechanosensitive channel